MLRSGLAIVISPDRIAEGKRLYELTSTPVHDIAAMMGVSRPTLQRRIKKGGWVPRKPAGHVTVREEVAPSPDGIAPTGDIFAMPPTTREERLALACGSGDKMRSNAAPRRQRVQPAQHPRLHIHQNCRAHHSLHHI